MHFLINMAPRVLLLSLLFMLLDWLVLLVFALIVNCFGFMHVPLTYTAYVELLAYALGKVDLK